VVFDSSTLFILPNGARRSPDAAWVTHARWDVLSDAEQDKPVPLAPDFALEILSPTDSLTETQAKMEEYKANAVRLGWLIDPKTRKVYIYRPGAADPEILDDPQTVSGDPELLGFVLDMNRVFPRRSP
jgi:Uma2 family endonuclease